MKRSSAAFVFVGAMLSAAGYGATFLLTAYFKTRGGSELDTAVALSAALVGTFAGVPIAAWGTGHVDASRLASGAAMALACGYLMLALATSNASPRGAGLLIGVGWGIFYLSAPMALSERIADRDRALWFTRFSVFQMTGICGGPALLAALVAGGRMSVEEAFLSVAGAASIAAILLWSFGSRERITTARGELRPWVRKLPQLIGSEAAVPIAMVGMGGGVFSGLMVFQSAFVAGTSAAPQNYFAWHAVTAIAARVTFGRIVTTAPQRPVIVGLLTFMTMGVGTLLWVPAWPFLHVISAVFTGLGYGLAYPLIQAWAVNKAPQDARHPALCWFVASYFLGVFGFPVVGTLVLMHFGKVYLIATVAMLGALETATAALAGFRFRAAIRSVGTEGSETH